MHEPVIAIHMARVAAIGETHNEVCIARALLMNAKLRFSSLAYEPALPGGAKLIDFCALSAQGMTVYVDVKTIVPVPTDRWEQFERAQREEWFRTMSMSACQSNGWAVKSGTAGSPDADGCWNMRWSLSRKSERAA